MHRLASRYATLSLAFAFTSLAGCLLVGCSGSDGSSSEPAATATSTSALIAGVPKKAWLELAVARFAANPGEVAAPTTTTTTSTAPTCSPQGPAGLADLSKTVSARANGFLSDVLGVISAVLSMPPTSADDHHATWGPMSGSEPAGVYRMDVERAADGAIAFQLSARSPTANVDAWKGLFHGATRVIDADHRVGDVELDLGALHAVDPVRHTATGGMVQIHFGNADGTTAIDMTFAQASGPETPPTNAKYRYTRQPDGSGAFEFIAHTTDPTTNPGERLMRVNTSWAVGGAGKSRAIELQSTPNAAAALVECWAPNAGLVFQMEEGSGRANGDPACCPTAP